MAKRRSSRKRKSPVGFFSVVLLLVGATGFGYLLTTRWLPLPASHEKMMSQTAPEKKVVLHERKKVKVYVLDVTQDEPKLVAETRRVPQGQDPHTSALQHLLATNEEQGDARYLIPQGTKLLALHVKDGVAYADFSSEIKDNFNGGSTTEALLVNAIVSTLTQFDDVKRVQILVEGKKVESLGGHLEISNPISGDSAQLDGGSSE